MKTASLLPFLPAVVLIVIGAAFVMRTDGLSVLRITPGNQINIGLIAPFSGDSGRHGATMLDAVEMAFADARIGRYIDLIVVDTDCDAQKAKEEVEKMIVENQVVAIIGEMCSGATLGAIPIIDKKEVVLISPASTSPDLSSASQYFFRTIPSDTIQGREAAALVYGEGLERLAIFYSDEPYGMGFKDVLTANFEELGGTVVIAEPFERTETDLRKQLTRIKSQFVDAIYIISNSTTSSAAILRQISDLRLRIALFGAEGLKDQALLDELSGEAEGLTVMTVSTGDRIFIERYIEEYGHVPGPFAAQGYDAGLAIIKALERGARTGEDIRRALQVNEFEGESGHILFDKNGDIAGNYDVYTVENGIYVFQSE